jgi:hypothetical protein
MAAAQQKVSGRSPQLTPPISPDPRSVYSCASDQVVFWVDGQRSRLSFIGSQGVPPRPAESSDCATTRNTMVIRLRLFAEPSGR